MELREMRQALRSAWWWPVVGAILGAGLALGASLLITPVYTSSTQFFVSTTETDTTQDLSQGSQFSQQRVTSYAQLIAGETLAKRVIERLRLNVTPSQLAEEISASAAPETVLIDVDVTDPSPQRAQQIAQTLGEEFTAYAEQLEARMANGNSPVRVTVTLEPEVPSSPSSPSLKRNTSLGLLAGLLLGGGAAIARRRLGRSVEDPSEAADLAGAPFIGSIHRNQALEERHTLEQGVAGRTAEEYRRLRNTLQFLDADEPPKVIMVSSALPGEGKTTMVVNLALGLSDIHRRVAVVDADLRDPKIAEYMSLLGGPGLTDVLAGTADLEDVVQTIRVGLSVIAAGSLPPDPGELLASHPMAAVVDKLRGDYDFVLVDAPPVLTVADASGLAGHMDGVLLTVRYGSTRKEQLRQAADTLEQVGAKILGVVLNIVPPKAELAPARGYGATYAAPPGRHATS